MAYYNVKPKNTMLSFVLNLRLGFTSQKHYFDMTFYINIVPVLHHVTPGLQETVHSTLFPTVQRKRGETTCLTCCDTSRMMTHVIDIPLSPTHGGIRADSRFGIVYLFLSLSVFCVFLFVCSVSCAQCCLCLFIIHS